MCGIAGQLSASPPDLSGAVRALAHRGPDDTGVQPFRAGELHGALGFTRLAIQDLSPKGHQPMCNEDGSVWVVFNGEIYNAPTLRRTLANAGHAFRSRTDTECILHGYELWGDEVVHALRGMFAFALWDGRRERLLLARDRIGIKPLFYWQRGAELSFASEIKGLLSLGAPRDVDPASVEEYLRYLYVPPPHTIYRAIRQLPPGHRMVVEKGALRVERWWDLAAVKVVERPERVVRAELRALVEQAVKLHLASDVPLGAFLSGGADSSTIVALMAQASPRPVRTFTLAFGERAYDETAYARAVAEKWGCDHQEIKVKPELARLLPAVVAGFDEPFGNPTAMLLHLLSGEARRSVTVALSGEGGDELFLGYPRYQGVFLAEKFSRVPRPLREVLARSLAERISDSSRGLHLFRRAREFLSSAALAPEAAYREWVAYRTREEAADLLAPELREAARDAARRDFLEECFALAPPGPAAARAAFADLHSFLPHNVLAYSDRMSMAHGLEVRVPFCDHLLVEYAASIPAGQRMPGGRLKRLLARAVSDLWPAKVRRRVGKVGLNPPLGVWLAGELRELVGDLLSRAAIARAGLLDPAPVAALLCEQRQGLRDRSLQIWSLVVLQAWHAARADRAAAAA